MENSDFENTNINGTIYNLCITQIRNDCIGEALEVLTFRSVCTLVSNVHLLYFITYKASVFFQQIHNIIYNLLHT